MDRSALRNFLTYGFDTDGGAGSDQMGSASYGGMNNENSQTSNQNDATGYPFLLQEYLRQQQYQAENTSFQQPAPTFDGSMPFPGLLSSNNMSNRSFTSFDNGTLASYNLPDQGRNATWFMGAGPPSMSGTQTSSASDLSTSDRMMLERLQATSNASFLVGNNASSATNMVSILPPATQRDTYAEQGILGPWSERSAGLLGSMVCSESSNQSGKVKRTRRKQPKDKPKRPLSAYNIFFKEERARLLTKAPPADGGDSEGQKRTANGKIGFENLAKIIGGKWQDLQPREVEYYKSKASADMDRYKKEMLEYNKKQGQSQLDDCEEADESGSGQSSKKQKTK
ncbi:hypothetical protein ACA910_008264 [Epithemia clementina (nom. ined.)]